MIHRLIPVLSVLGLGLFGCQDLANLPIRPVSHETATGSVEVATGSAQASSSASASASPTPTPRPTEPPLMPAAWSYLVGKKLGGLCVNPTTGTLYVVASDGFVPTTAVLTPQGDRRLDMLMRLAPDCDGCIARNFYPGGPVMSPDGKHFFVSDYEKIFKLGVYRFDMDTEMAFQVPFEWNGITTTGIGLGRSSVAFQDPTLPLLMVPGDRLYVLSDDGHGLVGDYDFGAPVRQVVPATGSWYFANLTADDDTHGTFVAFDSLTIASASFTVDKPVRAMASLNGWTVALKPMGALGSTGLTAYQLLQLDVAGGVPHVTGLAPCALGGSSVLCAIRPGKRQVVVASTEGAGVLLVDADQGVVARLDAGRMDVADLAFSPDGRTVYAAGDVRGVGTSVVAIPLP